MDNNQSERPQISDILTIFLSQTLLILFITLVIYTPFQTAMIISQKIPQETFENASNYEERMEIAKEITIKMQALYEEDPLSFEKEYIEIIVDKPFLLFWNRILWGICFLIPAYFFLTKLMKTKVSKLDEELGFPQIKLGMSAGLVTFFMVTSFVVFLTLIGYKPNMNEFEIVLSQKLKGNLYLLLTSIFVIGIVTGMIEELFFRGYLLADFMHRGFPREGLIFTSVIFGAMHYDSNASPIIPFILMFVGYIFGLYYIKTQNIWVSMSAHATYNSSGLILAYFFGDKVV